MGAEEVRVGDLILKDPDNPNLGFMLDPDRVNPHIKEYEQRLGEIPVRMSLTDGVPIPSDRTDGVGWPD